MPRVDFHAHSSFSDGLLSPEELAGRMAARGIAYAALTDHDTCEGSARFREALARRGIACVEGVELTTRSPYGEAHILAYALGGQGAALASLAARRRKGGEPPDALETLRLARRAGAATFLAHPLALARDPALLEEAFDSFAAAGLDGVEAVYGQYGEGERRLLASMAERRGLAVCAGSDFHEPGSAGQDEVLELSAEQWRAFRALLSRGAGQAPAEGAERPAGRPARAPRRGPPSHGPFALRILLPALAALALFLAVLFLFIPPRIKTMLLDRKKDTIRELTISASSILSEYAEDARLGRSTLEEAQRGAATRIRDIRYGREGKDYFWITDMAPRMIMHPYRPELEGSDLGEYRDERGLKVFVEFVRVVAAKEEGYVEYLWQWKDDRSHIVPKLSYVRRFAPWDWVIGTGIYLDDVNAEIAALTGSLVALSLGVAAALALLLAFLVQQSLAIERGRTAAELAVRESRERYRALVEASTEGMVIVIGGACTFANAFFLEMTGFSEAELCLHSFAEIVEFYREGESLEASSRPAERQFECRLRRKTGEAIDVLLSSTSSMFGDREGLVYTVKEARIPAIGGEAGRAGEPRPAGPAEAATIGFFRADWSRRAGLLEADPAARRILGIALDAEPSRLGLFALFPDGGDSLYRLLSSEGAARRLPYRLEARGSPPLDLLVTAFVARGDGGRPLRIDGIVEDVSVSLREQGAKDELLASLQSASMYLQAPVSGLAPAPLVCGSGETIGDAARRMRREGRGEILVQDSAGGIIGILTSRDLAERVVAEGLDGSKPVGSVMTAPLRSLPQEASVSDALRALRSPSPGRLVLRDGAGAATGTLRRADLLDAWAESPRAILDAIPRAGGVDELGELWAQLKEGLRSLRAGGLRIERMSRILTAAHDAAIGMLLGLARAELGAEPCPFAFLALGSAGRAELLPGSDQDNAIVFLPDGTGTKAELGYFLELGERVCRPLAAIGVPLCAGGTSALSEKCCASLQDWESRFARWIAVPEPEELLDIHVFFDFRAVGGDRSLADSLRRSVFASLEAEPAFFVHLANGVRTFKLPPLPLRGSADAKEGSSLIAALIRAYALKRGIAATNSFERLAALEGGGQLSAETARETAEALEFYLSARYALEAGPVGAGRGGLGHGGEALARIAHAQAALLQKRLGYDFLGASAQ